MTETERVWGTRYWLFALVFLPSLLELCLEQRNPQAHSVDLQIAYFLINFVAVLLLFRTFLRQSWQCVRQNLGRAFGQIVCAFLVYQVMCMALSVLTLYCFPGFYNVNDASIAGIVMDHWAIMAVGVIVMVPLVEEVFYRGLVFAWLRNRGRIAKYGVSTLLFALVHVMEYVGAYHWLHLVICLIQYLPAGVVLAWAYERSGTIFVPVGIHMAVNAMGIGSMR